MLSSVYLGITHLSTVAVVSSCARFCCFLKAEEGNEMKDVK